MELVALQLRGPTVRNGKTKTHTVVVKNAGNVAQDTAIVSLTVSSSVAGCAARVDDPYTPQLELDSSLTKMVILDPKQRSGVAFRATYSCEDALDPDQPEFNIAADVDDGHGLDANPANDAPIARTQDVRGSTLESPTLARTAPLRPVAGAVSNAAAAGVVAVQVGQQNGGTANAAEFNAASITVAAGDTVRWKWFSGVHDVVSYSETVPGTPDWQSSIMTAAGQSHERTFTAAGTVTYYCSIHAPRSDADPSAIDRKIAEGKMVGKVVVQAAAQPSPTPMSTEPSPTPTSAPKVASISDPTPTAAAGAASTAGGSSAASVGAGSTSAATQTPMSTVESNTGSATSKADPVVAGESALPTGGGSPPSGAGIPWLTVILILPVALLVAVIAVRAFVWRRHR